MGYGERVRQREIAMPVKKNGTEITTEKNRKLYMPSSRPTTTIGTASIVISENGIAIAAARAA
jgi:hypothetical protein